MSLSAQGDYREDIEFRNLQEVLGSGSLAGKVMVVEDIKTGSVHAMKTVSEKHDFGQERILVLQHCNLVIFSLLFRFVSDFV